MSNTPWYQKGLHFECTGCGGCCTGAPGYAWVTPEEVDRMAQHLDLAVPEFSLRYLRYVDGHYALLEDPTSFDCVFLEDKKRCSIYPVRPVQCRTYPFWPENLKSPEHWDNASKFCEGIREDAPLVPLSEIEKQCRDQAGIDTPVTRYNEDSK